MMKRPVIENPMLEEARRFYDLGYDVHWVEAPIIRDRATGKKPIGGWARTERYTWTMLEKTFRAGYNLGFQPGETSRVGGRRLIVVDFDYQDPELEGEGRSELRRLIGETGVTARTGSGMGEHYHFLVPDGMKLPVGKVLWSAGEHNEIRVISTGGNVILPPSRHWTGGVYSLVGDGAAGEIPESLISGLAGVGGEGGGPDGGEDIDFDIGDPIDLRRVGTRTRLAKLILGGLSAADEGKTRSEVIHEVVRELHRKGFSREVIAGTLLCEAFKISEKALEHQGSRAREKWVRTEVARIIRKVGEEGNQEKNRLEGMLSEFSEKYCHVLYGGDTRICYREGGEIRFMRERAFISIMAHSGYLAGGKLIEPAKIWLTHPKTPVYDRVVFDPQLPPYRSGERGILNLWQGFAISGAEGGSCERFKDHLLRNVCGGNDELYRWLWNWIAHIFQRPWEKPSTAVVLRGETGVGKSLVAGVICHLIGEAHAMSTSNPELLAGKFNKIIGDKLFVEAEEISWGGDTRGNAILKDRISAETMQIEPKGIDSMTVKSYQRYMLITNEGWAVNVMPRERRWALFEVGVDSQRDEVFFAGMLAELSGGGYSQLMWELMRTEIVDSWLRNPPVTEAMRGQQEQSLDRTAQWILGCIKQGWFYRRDQVPGKKDWLLRVDPVRMLAACRASAGRHGEYITEASLGDKLKQIFGPIRSGVIAGGTRRAWRMPDTPGDALALFNRYLGSRD